MEASPERTRKGRTFGSGKNAKPSPDLSRLDESTSDMSSLIITPVIPPSAAPTIEVLSPLPSSSPSPIEITHATNATISAASSIAGDSITIPAIAVETTPYTTHSA
ncbi:hypothetical protein K7X08_033783 [Anisodus acutangulus]|uniref:Uncharacterized protein n=1 Tax=Anisodus acutangulus TaxID=402998 RepID=A0A9Q1M685_9SOLA|nr:hypothetical protein K7X08_033783 [Anisodus acutangulus]